MFLLGYTGFQKTCRLSFFSLILLLFSLLTASFFSNCLAPETTSTPQSLPTVEILLIKHSQTLGKECLAHSDCHPENEKCAPDLHPPRGLKCRLRCNSTYDSCDTNQGCLNTDLGGLCFPGDQCEITTNPCPDEQSTCLPWDQDSSFCLPPGNAKPGEPCTIIQGCSHGNLCVSLEPTKPNIGRCLTFCSLDETKCPEDTNCIDTSHHLHRPPGNIALCLPELSGDLKEGAECGLDKGLCQAGFYCTTARRGNLQGTCRKLCQENCSEDHHCYPINGTELKVCLPINQTVEGHIELGQPCGPQLGNCNSGLLCVKAQPLQENGTCLDICGPEKDCTIKTMRCLPLIDRNEQVCYDGEK